MLRLQNASLAIHLIAISAVPQNLSPQDDEVSIDLWITDQHPFSIVTGADLCEGKNLRHDMPPSSMLSER
jgi:hypothetical protein